MLSRLVYAILVVILMLQIGCSYKNPVPVDLPESEMDDYAKGLLDGERDAHGNLDWLLIGFCLPVIGPAAAWIDDPTQGFFMCNPPSPYALAGRSQDYIKGYAEAYRSKSRAKNANDA